MALLEVSTRIAIVEFRGRQASEDTTARIPATA
jgi:hypothetical protein